MSAKIVVDPVARRGVLDGQFFVNDLESALRIAKNGDTIFIEEGSYSGRTLRQQSGNMKMVTEINKSLTLVSLMGSILCLDLLCKCRTFFKPKLWKSVNNHLAQG